MALDTEGNIKPCPSIQATIGNIRDFDLRDIASNTVIQSYNIAKDQIEVCKDCEFRYICHDCRAYLSPDKINAKPKYCNYDPYTATWQ
jgi:radical SAM protein with 4Fe4S-binding SPASM domain